LRLEAKAVGSLATHADLSRAVTAERD